MQIITISRALTPMYTRSEWNRHMFVFINLYINFGVEIVIQIILSEYYGDYLIGRSICISYSIKYVCTAAMKNNNQID